MHEERAIDIFIINLARSTERRSEIVRKMNVYKLPFQFFNAVDGNDIPEQTMEKILSGGNNFKNIYGRDMKQGEAGAALSHWAIYKKLVSENIDFAIILEDDVEFDNRLKHIAENKNKIVKVLEQFDLILLGYCRNDLDYRKPGDCSFWGRIKLDEIIKVGVPVHWYWAAIGYLISKAGARKLLEQGDLPTMQADFTTANSPTQKVRLGIIREPVIWPGVLNDISTIRDSNANSDYDFNEAEERLYKEKSLIRKKLTKIDQLKPARNAYRVFKKKCVAAVETLKIFFLKVSPKQNQFVIENKQL